MNSRKYILIKEEKDNKKKVIKLGRMHARMPEIDLLEKHPEKRQ